MKNTKQTSKTNSETKDKILRTLTILIMTLIVMLSIAGVNNIIKNGVLESLTPLKKEEMEVIPLYINPEEQLTEESITLLKQEIGDSGISLGSVVNEDLFRGNAVKSPNIVLTTSDESVINLSKIDGPVAFEVVADWCGYCQQETAEYLSQAIEDNPEVTFIQYFQTGAQDEMQNFYMDAGVEPDERLIICFANEEMNSWLDENDFESFPTFYFFNQNKKVSGSLVGMAEPGLFNAYASVAFSDKFNTYNLETKYGVSASKLIKNIHKAQKYVGSLNEIEVPIAYLEGE